MKPPPAAAHGRRALLRFAALCTVAASVGESLAAPLAAQQPGTLVIIGGGLSRTNTAVYGAIAGARQGSGPVCIVPTASATPDSAMAGPVATFADHGMPAVGVLIDSSRPETARDSAVVRQLRACSGFFFVGGVQSRIVAALRPGGSGTPALEAILHRWRAGAVLSGSSAGAAIMSDPMIAGGSSAGALRAGVHRADAADDNDAGGVSITPGLGFFHAGLADQHFLARGRFGRLAMAVADSAVVDLGFGIDENTALIVAGDRLSAVGASGVVVLDATGARTTDGGVEGVRVALMSAGDRYDLRTRTLTIGADKQPLQPMPARTITDAFARWEMLHLLQHFASQPQLTGIAAPVEGGTVELTRAADFAAAWNGAAGVQGTAGGLSIQGVLLRLTRNR